EGPGVPILRALKVAREREGAPDRGGLARAAVGLPISRGGQRLRPEVQAVLAWATRRREPRVVGPRREEGRARAHGRAAGALEGEKLRAAGDVGAVGGEIDVEDLNLSHTPRCRGERQRPYLAGVGRGDRPGEEGGCVPLDAPGARDPRGRGRDRRRGRRRRGARRGEGGGGPREGTAGAADARQ